MSTTALLGSQSNTEYGISLPTRGHPVGDLALSPVEPGGASQDKKLGRPSFSDSMQNAFRPQATSIRNGQAAPRIAIS